ncbi:MAG: SDR family NAD(P)-dependent oxidoreductase [Ardenticatenales bacterium]|nr:SDR family NAD(P)-dependent oxidoreductase [Ardenticatenales bacterium]
MSNEELLENLDGTEIAVIGMALRVPGAQNVNEYWANLRDGVESVREFSEEELREAGVSDSLLNNPHYVRLGAPLEGAKEFDAAFFGFSPRDAAIMDPQHRHFIEISWEALEHAGYDPANYKGAIGIFGGSGHNIYMAYNLLTNPALMESVGFFLVRHTSNDKDFLVTRVSYLFDLKGPAVNVQTACSTSLVAIHMGVQSLLNGESDMILAGGVTFDLPLDTGYVYEEGEILSQDGHCRAFDADSTGTIFGSGGGVVVLKRLEDAIKDGDTIHAIIRGTAINNDGSGKVGYLAPSVDGQAAAVGEAIELANIDPETISFIECHGTGTAIGDPIEVAALTQAFRNHTDKKQFCALGSVKTNIGHLDTAAGIAGFIKTCLALENQQLPPTLHYQKPNPRIDFANSPFFVNAALRDWESDGEPRRAGVSSLGVGGTNAHIILEEAPELDPSGPSRAWQLLPVSAKGPKALDQATANLATFLAQNPDVNFADTAYTLKVGRQPLDVRRFVVAQDAADAAAVLGGADPTRLLTGTAKVQDRPVVFMFPGQGAQYADMGRGLYESEPVFRETVDQCATILQPLLGLDIRTLLFPAADGLEAANEQLAQTAMTQPAIFTIEYAMAQLWLSWGLQPKALIGHSIGEYTAACVAGVFSLADALKVVAARGKLMGDLPGGSMLVIPQSEAEVRPYLTAEISMAALNGPAFCVVAGPHDAIDQLQAQLEAKEIAVRRLRTSHAFHSAMMDPMLAPFAAVVGQTKRNEPTIPYVSNVSGDWITMDQINDPQYWAQHVRSAVNFVGGLGTILATDAEVALLEVGPGRTLSTFAKQVAGPHGKTTYTSLRHPQKDIHDLAFALTTLGEMWAAGGINDWSGFYAAESRHRIPLPTYPFQHQEYWVEPGKQSYTGTAGEISLAKRPNIADWFYTPTWQQAARPTPVADAEPVKHWVFFLDEAGIGQQLATKLAVGAAVTTVQKADGYAKMADGQYTINPEEPADYLQLMRDLSQAGTLPDGIAYLWPLSDNGPLAPASAALQSAQTDAFYGQLFLAQALADQGSNTPLQWYVVSNHMQQVAGEPVVHAEKALALGPVKVIAQEYPHVCTHSVDVAWPTRTARQTSQLVDQLAAELQAGSSDEIIAYRGQSRWQQSYEALPLSEEHEAQSLLKVGGVYLITGGTGGLGLKVAEHLAETVQAKLVLTARTELPPRAGWANWLEGHKENDGISRRIRQVQALEAAGAEVLVLAADVTDREQMATVLTQTVAQFGRLDGVFHAAGGVSDAQIQLKDRQGAADVLAAKVSGTLVLAELLADIELDFLALFSSISAITGISGQIDYAAANAFLNAFAHQQMAEDGRLTIAIDWGAWQEVGMAVQTAVELGLIEDEASAIAVDYPFIDRWYEKADEDLFATRFSNEAHWLLDEHRIRGGNALIPGTGYLELVRAANSQRSNGSPIELSDVFFMAPFMVADGESRELRISLSKEQHASFVISSKLGNGQQEHVRGQLRNLTEQAPQTIDIQAILARCQERIRDFERYEHDQLAWGARWNNLRRLQYGQNEAVATLALPAEYAGDLAQHKLHPAVLDLATAGAQDLISGFDAARDFYVPFSYGRLRLLQPLTERAYSHIRYRPSADRETAIFDITIVDEAGTVLVDIKGFVMRRAVGEIAAAADGGSEAKQDPFLETLANGIAPEEGVRALRRALAGRILPQVIISSQDLHGLLQRAANREQSNAAGGAGAGIGHDRPDLSTPFVAPSDKLETDIAAIWEEMLGIKGVGVHDDFFELGGHSLLLTQVITRVKKLSQAEISLFSLFEASTISELATEIRKAEEEQGDGPAVQAPTLARVSRDRYRTKVTKLKK